MNRLVAFGCAVGALALSAAAASAGPFFGGCGCAAPCDDGCCAAPAAPDQIHLRVEIEETPCKVETPTKARADTATVRKTDSKDVPCTKMVPVQVVDPCTGCAHTEMQCVPDTRKLTTTALDIAGPGPEECKTKTEEKVHQTIRICIEHRPAPCPTPAPPLPAK